MTDDDIVPMINAYERVHGYPPTQTDIAAMFGVSRTAIARRLRRLVEAGAISITPGTRRTIRANTKGESHPL